jgi:hypothetical protein
MRISTAAVGVALAVAAPALAHHSISRDYHRNQRVEIEGQLIDVALINPHSEIQLEVRSDGETVDIWQLELDDPGDLADQGIVAGTLQHGDTLIVNGNPARDGSMSMFVQRFVRPADGLQYDDD